MQITVNGEEREVDDGTSIRELLAALDVSTRALAVERNREIIPRAEHADCRLGEGDCVEIVTLVGGG